MNFQRRLAKLNKQFERFGLNPFGELKYKWAHTTELHYYIEVGRGDKPYGAEWIFTAGVYVPSYHYERHTWADTGHGPRWLMAEWNKPISQDEWIRKLGHSFPWPSRGEYLPCENLTLEPNEEPDERLTRLMVECLEFHLSLTSEERQTKLMQMFDAQKKSERTMIHDEAEDAMTAFGKIPGSRDSSFSLPLPDSQIQKSGGTPLHPKEQDFAYRN